MRNPMVKFCIPYMIVLLVPLITGLYAYTQTLSVIEEDVKSSNLALLHQTRDMLDVKLSEMEQHVQRLANHTKVVRFFRVQNPFEGEAVFQLYETVKDLYDYGMVNNLLLDYFIFFKNSDMVMKDSVAYKIKDFYPHVFEYEDKHYSGWRDSLLGGYHYRSYWPAEHAVYNKKSYRTITYVQSLGTSAGYHGAVAVLIDESELRTFFNGFDLSSGGRVYILDRNGNLLSRFGQEHKGEKELLLSVKPGGNNGFAEHMIEGERVFVSYTVSERHGWMYAVIQPSHIFLKKVNAVQHTTLLIFILTLLVGVLLSFGFAYRNSRPIRKVVNHIAEALGGAASQSRDVFAVIEQTVTGLIHANEGLRGKIEEQLPFLRASFFERLFKGEFSDERETMTLMAHAGLHIKAPAYAAAVLQLRLHRGEVSLELLHEMNLKRDEARSVLAEYIGRLHQLHPIEEDKIAVLLPLPDIDVLSLRAELEDDLLRVAEVLRDRHQMSVLFSVGRPQAGLTDVCRSYEEARRTLTCKWWDESSVIVWYDDLPHSQNRYDYPADLETKLINAAKCGDTAQVLRILEDLYERNIKGSVLPLFTVKLFIYDLWSSLMKLFDQLERGESHLDQQILTVEKELQELKEPAMVFQAITFLFEQICSFVNQRKKSGNAMLIERILNQLETGYADCSLSLTSVADKFHVSEVYLSQFIKEQTGFNFSEKLEKIRMEHAYRLLGSTDLSVTEIAVSVGYSSYNTFSRAFKRVNGVSATAIRGSRHFETP